MGFTKPALPPVDPDTFMRQPLMHRMKVLALHWVEHGFGTPRMVHAIYIAKLLFFYIPGGVVVATTTSRLPAFWHVAQWWSQPIVYQKAVLWTVLLETIGVAGSWGPLAGKFKPMTGGIRFWARTGTIRLRPWKRVPLTAGDRRTRVDVALYLALMAGVTVPLVLPGVPSHSLSAAVPGNRKWADVTMQQVIAWHHHRRPPLGLAGRGRRLRIHHRRAGRTAGRPGGQDRNRRADPGRLPASAGGRDRVRPRPRAGRRPAGRPAAPRVARAFRRFRRAPGAFKVDFAVRGGVPWANPDVSRAGTVHLGGSYAEITATEREINAGHMPQRPFVLVGQQRSATGRRPGVTGRSRSLTK